MLNLCENNSVLKSKDGEHVASYYAATANITTNYQTLEDDREAEVCIIGGGFTGLSTAVHLAEQGVDVVLLEAEKISWGASGRNGGHVGKGQRLGQQTLENRYGKDVAKQLWSLGLEAVDVVDELIRKHAIDCDLKKGILQVAAKSADAAYMRLEAEKLRDEYGYQHSRFVEKAELDQMVGSKKYYGGVLDMGSMHLHPLNYALGIAKAATAAGASLYEHSRVSHYSKQDGSVIVHTDKGSVKAKKVVLACNGYLGQLEPRIAGKIMPINNFVLATEPLEEELARELIRDDVAIQDSLYVINYWKLSGDNRLIFGGGENYTHRFPSNLMSFIRKYMLRVYPQLKNTKIDYAWGGTLSITMSRMPHFGQLDDDIYYAQGYSGHGVPIASLAGKLLAEALTGNPERFNTLADLPSQTFPGGTLLRWPGLVAGMLYHTMLDKIG